MPSPEPSPGSRGFVIPIGGAEDKVRGRRIHKRFVELCGGKHARIVVIPTASTQSSTGRNYVELYRDLGPRHVTVLDIRDRRAADDNDNVTPLETASGVFLTGGNQLRLSTILGGTRVATALRRVNARGAHVAGTSAGAAFVSEHMIAFGKEGPTPIAGCVTLTPGLGLTNRVIVDQHFRQRDRLGRLLTALAYNPFAIGIGLDEDTATFIGPDNVIEVVGSGAVTVVDVGDLDFSSMASAKEGGVVQLVGIKAHILADGARYDLVHRKATAGPVEED